MPLDQTDDNREGKPVMNLKVSCLRPAERGLAFSHTAATVVAGPTVYFSYGRTTWTGAGASPRIYPA